MHHVLKCTPQVREGMQLSLRCPSLHMRPASLTPLMLAAGAGHIEVRGALVNGDPHEEDSLMSYC